MMKSFGTNTSFVVVVVELIVVDKEVGGEVE